MKIVMNEIIPYHLSHDRDLLTKNQPCDRRCCAHVRKQKEGDDLASCTLLFNFFRYDLQWLYRLSRRVERDHCFQSIPHLYFHCGHSIHRDLVCKEVVGNAKCRMDFSIFILCIPQCFHGTCLLLRHTEFR